MVIFFLIITLRTNKVVHILTSIFLRENCIFSKFTDVYAGEPITNKINDACEGLVTKGLYFLSNRLHETIFIVNQSRSKIKRKYEYWIESPCPHFATLHRILSMHYIFAITFRVQ